MRRLRSEAEAAAEARAPVRMRKGAGRGGAVPRAENDENRDPIAWHAEVWERLRGTVRDAARAAESASCVDLPPEPPAWGAGASFEISGRVAPPAKTAAGPATAAWDTGARFEISGRVAPPAAADDWDDNEC